MSDESETTTPHVGLLVKDPGSLFAFWELPGSARQGLRERYGDRAGSLAQVTLRLDEGGVTRDVIPPAGSRSHYLATEHPGESAQVELGWTLPSGRFEPIARSASVSVPRAEPSATLSRSTLRFPAERDRARKLQAVQVRKARPRPRPGAGPAPAGGSDAFRPARSAAGDALVSGGASDAFSPPGGSHRR